MGLTFFTRIHPPPPSKVIGVYYLLGREGHLVRLTAFHANTEQWCLNDFCIGCNSDVSCVSGKPRPVLAILSVGNLTEPINMCNPACLSPSSIYKTQSLQIRG